MRAERPELAQVLVKLNEGVSGEGNALVDLRGLPAPGDRASATRSASGSSAMQLRARDATLDGYLAKLGERGGVVEERIAGDEFRSPSVQLRVTPLGEVELLSTHDQLLGGPSGQTLPRLPVPRRPRVRAARSRAEAAKVGARLAARGRDRRFALDFVDGADGTATWDAVRDRDQPAQGRHDAPVPDAPVPHRRDATTPRRAVFTAPSGQREVLRRERPRREPGVPGPDPRRPVRHRRAPRPALRPVAPDRRRLPHDGRARRAGQGRDDRGRRHGRGAPTGSTARRSRCSTRRLLPSRKRVRAAADAARGRAQRPSQREPRRAAPARDGKEGGAGRRREGRARRGDDLRARRARRRLHRTRRRLRDEHARRQRRPALRRRPAARRGDLLARPDPGRRRRSRALHRQQPDRDGVGERPRLDSAAAAQLDDRLHRQLRGRHRDRRRCSTPASSTSSARARSARRP